MLVASPGAAAAGTADEPARRLLALALPAAEELHRLAGDPGLSVLLADAEGLVLGVVGSLDIAHRSLRLQPLTRPMRSPPQRLCLTEPIAATPHGLLAIASASASAHRAHGGLGALRALLETTAALIEHHLAAQAPGACFALHLHPRAELLGTPLEGLAVFDASGHLLASNRTARQWLAVDTPRPWSQRALRQLARSPAGVALSLRARDGRPLAAIARLLPAR